MFSGTSPRHHPKTLLILLLFTMVLFVQCGKKPGHDKTPYLLKKKLGLNTEQAREVEDIINEIKERRKRDREQYAGDNESLLKAAKERRSQECSRIESILNENQKARFRDVSLVKEVNDLTLIIADRLGLDRTTTNRIDKIVVKLPADHEIMTARKAGNTEELSALIERTEQLYSEIAYFLNEEQRDELEKIIQENLARTDGTK